MTKRSDTPVEEAGKKVKIDCSKHRSLVWFRSDLRCKDNRALSQALSYNGTPDGVLAVYIVSKDEWLRHDWGAVKVDFIRRNLKILQLKLQSEYNVQLLILEVDKFSQVPEKLTEFAKEMDISVVWFNNEPEWDETQRDCQVDRAIYGRCWA